MQFLFNLYTTYSFFQSQSSVEEEIEVDNIQIATTNIDEDMEIRGKKVMKKYCRRGMRKKKQCHNFTSFCHNLGKKKNMQEKITKAVIFYHFRVD